MAVVNLMEKLFEMIRGDVTELKTDVAELKNRMDAVEDRLDRVEDRLERVEDRLERVEDRLTGVETSLASVNTGIEALAGDVRKGFSQVLTMLRERDKKVHKQSVVLSNHESRIVALETAPPTGGRPPKH